MSIGTLNEWTLHASLKEHYKKPGDRLEESIDGYVIDIVRDKELIEIQTTNFSSMKKKLNRLLQNHHVKVIHPIASRRVIIRESLDGTQIFSKRKSPKKGNYYDLFQELIYIPHIARRDNFSLEVVLTHEIERKRNDGKGSWRRRGWSVVDRELVEVVESKKFDSLKDYLGLIPEIDEPFTNTEIAVEIGIPRWIARKMTYTLSKMGVLKRNGKRGNAHLFSRDDCLFS